MYDCTESIASRGGKREEKTTPTRRKVMLLLQGASSSTVTSPAAPFYPLIKNPRSTLCFSFLHFLIRFSLSPPHLFFCLTLHSTRKSWRYDEMKNPFFTFLSPDNFYATAEDIDPQLLTESIKSFKSQARDAVTAAVRRKTAAASSSSSHRVNRNRHHLSQQQHYSNHINHKR